MNQTLRDDKGITLIALIITIIVLLILVGVCIATLTGNNGILTQARKSVILSEVGEIQERVKLNSMDDENGEGMTGKLSELNLNIDRSLIDKYDDILYVKDNELYLDFITNFPNMESFKNNKEKIEILKENMKICYDRIKTYNKLLNPSFDDGLDSFTTKMTQGNVTEVVNEGENNYLHMEMYISSGNTQLVAQEQKVANNYGEKIYTFAKYRNSYVETEHNHKINNTIIYLSRSISGGYDQGMLSKQDFISSYGKGWKNASQIRIIQEQTRDFNVSHDIRRRKRKFNNMGIFS